MTRWGLCLVSIGCLIMMLSGLRGSEGILLCFAGLLVVAVGFVLIYRDKKDKKTLKKTAKKK